MNRPSQNRIFSNEEICTVRDTERMYYPLKRAKSTTITREEWLNHAYSSDLDGAYHLITEIIDSPKDEWHVIAGSLTKEIYHWQFVGMDANRNHINLSVKNILKSDLFWKGWLTYPAIFSKGFPGYRESSWEIVMPCITLFYAAVTDTAARSQYCAYASDTDRIANITRLFIDDSYSMGLLNGASQSLSHCIRSMYEYFNCKDESLATKIHWHIVDKYGINLDHIKHLQQRAEMSQTQRKQILIELMLGSLEHDSVEKDTFDNFINDPDLDFIITDRMEVKL